MRRPRWRINLSRRAALGVSVLCVGLVLTAVTAVMLTGGWPDAPYQTYAEALQSHGVDPANPRAVLEARNKFPDVAQAFAAYQKDYFSRNPFLKSLYDRQTAADAAVQAGTLSRPEWVRQTHDLQQQVFGAQGQKYQGQGQRAMGIPVVDNYLALRDDPANNDPANPTALYDAEAAYRAKLSPEERQVLDDHVGWGGLNTTPAVQAYHTATRMISDAGYYKVADQTAAVLSRGHYPTWNALTARYAQDAKAKRIELASYPLYQEALSAKQEREMIFLMRNPKIDALRSFWYGTAVHSMAAYREILQRTGVRPKLVTP